MELSWNKNWGHLKGIPVLREIKCVILPEQLISATRCRVDYHRINAGVVSLGESLRLIAAEGPL